MAKRNSEPDEHPFFKPHKRLEVLIQEQGLMPLKDMKELEAGFWPEDESIDDFVNTVRLWRREGR